MWRPLLTGSLRARALTTLDEIVAALPEPEDASPRHESTDDASLAGGAAGLAILCESLARAGLDDGENAHRFLERAIETSSSHPTAPSFFSGFPGVAWAITHLGADTRDDNRDDNDDNDGDPNEDVDDVLHDLLNEWDGVFDVVNGLVGIGVYQFARLPRPSARENLELVVARLRDLADEEEDGFAWFTGPDRIPNWQNDLYPRGYYNLGVAHGIPGVIAFLGDACEAGIARELAAPMLEGAVQWLLRRRLPATEVASFPNYVAPTTDEREFKLAWCYGDLGIAVTLLRAARATGNAQWEAAAIEIARRAALRPAQGSGVHDASLCHGAAGVAHLFNRLFQMTGDRTLRDAARFWFEHALDMKKPGEGIAGYAARFMNGKREVFWEADPGLLTGATGIALALLAAATNVEPQWDAMLLLSSPSGSIA